MGIENDANGNSDEACSSHPSKRHQVQSTTLEKQEFSLAQLDTAGVLSGDFYDSLFATDEFSRMMTPASSENTQLPTPEWSSEASPSLSQALGTGDGVFFGTEPQSRNSTRDNRPCTCIPKAIRQHEDVCINLQWASRGLTSVSPAEMLQCLKRGMEVYHELLECRSHTGQPEHISLLVSTCDMMVAGTEHLVLMVVGDEGGGQSELQAEKRTHVPKAAKTYQSRHHFGQIVLDEEDERCVLHSLLAVRARRLRALLERLHQVADRDGRPIHIRLIQHFRTRCQAIISSLESQNHNSI